MKSVDTLIVGAGLAGLACAVRLHEAGHQALIVERSDGVGGRVRTDDVDGFLLDRGFQVYLSAYPEAARILDIEALDLRRFRAGAIVFSKGKRHRMMDVFRHPVSLPGTVLQPIGSPRDKLLVGLLRLRSLHGRSKFEDQRTDDYLRHFGFSRDMIDRFFRAFYGGIFLERELRTSSRMFEFTFQMFSRGHATLPSKGMGAIPAQLADRLPEESIRLHTEVAQLDSSGVTLANNDRIVAKQVVVATDATSAGRLLPKLEQKATGWRSVTNLYFAVPVSPLNEAIIALNGDAAGPINSVCVLSDVAPDYAPAGQALISVAALGLPGDDSLEGEVRKDLAGWFGEAAVKQWRHLRTDRIPHALPEQPPQDPHPDADESPFRQVDGVFVCGDHTHTASIEGALVAGDRTAAAILEGKR
ncbi:MAG: NAD(P)/FAD-dependent oxidoreductase [Verrucomicrobiota bacterium]